MKSKDFKNQGFNVFLEKSVFILLIIVIFLSIGIAADVTAIYRDNDKIKTSEEMVAQITKELEKIKVDDSAIKNFNFISYDLWLRECASVANEYIYNNTAGLKIFVEKSQEELDEISKNFKIMSDNNDYGSLVKFIIIDKKRNTFFTNDVHSINVIKNKVSMFSKENGELFNYVSSLGKWYNISYNIQSCPYYKVNSAKVGIESVDPDNFIEAYWFPKDYIYSKKDEGLFSTITKNIKKSYESEIDLRNKNINTVKSNIKDKKNILIVGVGLILVTFAALYFIGEKRIIAAFKNNSATKLFRYITNGIENKGTLFKITVFIIFTLVTVYMISDLKSINMYLGFKNILCDSFIAFYFIYIVPKFIKFCKYLDRIMNGINKITDGDLNHVIEEKGDKALVNLAHDINVLNKGFKVSIEDQIKNERLKSELVTNVSHDLKTPLTSIINYTDILLRESISEEEKERFIKILNVKSLKLKKLIEDLFEISKINSGKIEINKGTVDVVELVDQSIAEYSDTEIYMDKNLEFIIRPFSPNIEMSLDGNKMSRVFENLINNALKYSLKDTRVYVDIEDVGKGVKIAFKSISESPLNFNKDEIFERFTRGDKSRNSEVDGSGLGLAIAKSIVELHEGIMYIDFDGDLFKAIIELYY